MSETVRVTIEGLDALRDDVSRLRVAAMTLLEMNAEIIQVQRSIKRRVSRLARLEQERNEAMDVDFTDVKARVSRLTDTVDSAELAFQELAAKIADLSNRPSQSVEELQAELAALAESIDQDSTELAQAVANTGGEAPPAA